MLRLVQVLRSEACSGAYRQSVASKSSFVSGDTETVWKLAYVDEYVRSEAMLHFPEVQAKAQAEIDKAVGRSRIPEFSDMESLPYIMAVIKEVARYVD